MVIPRANLSDKVSDWLLDAIESNRYQPGDRLPSVERLAEELEVGRSSVREALRKLQALGRVSLRHGVGVFVAVPTVQLGSTITSFSESIRERGMVPGSVVLQRTSVQPEPYLAERLKLREGEAVYFIKRLRLANGEPLAIESSYTPCSLFPGLLEGPWTLDASLYLMMEKKFGITPYIAQQTVSTTLIMGEDSQLLQIKEGSPGLAIHTTAYNQEWVPLEYSQDTYRGDRYEYTVTLAKQR
jgi:GntR family transcriptional regulator